MLHLFAPVRAVERRMEEKPALHMLHLSGECLLWSGVALLVSPAPPLDILGYQLPLLLYHLVLGYAVHRHIFRYELKKATKETWPIRRLWALMVPGHMGLLFLMSQSYALGAVAAILLPLPVRYFITRPLPVEHERGTKVTTVHRVRERFEGTRPPSDQGYELGGVQLPTKDMVTHTLNVGTTRSGKSMSMSLALQDILRNSYPGHERRALITDFKPEFYSLLVGWGIPEDSITLMNASDARGYCWHLAKDFTTAVDSEAIGSILIPDVPNAGSGKFFNDGARMLVVRMVQLLMRYAPGNWYFRDLILALESEDIFIPLLSCDPDLAPVLKTLGSGETRDSVIATLATYIERYRVVAAYMDAHMRAGRLHSITDWKEGHGCVLVGFDRKNEALIRPIYTLYVTRVAQVLTSEHTSGYTFLFLDELPELGRIGNLERVARLAAAYKVCLVLAFQAISDLREVYGQEIANSIIGQCDHAAYLRVLDHETAEWAAKQIGETTVREKLATYVAEGWGTGRSGRGRRATTNAEHLDRRFAVPPEHFLNLPKPDKDSNTGIHGVYKVGHMVYPYEVPSNYLSQHLLAEDKTVPAYMPIAQEHETLRRWTQEDMVRLGFDKLFKQAGLLPHDLRETTFEGLLGPAESTAPLAIEQVDFSFLNTDETVIDGEIA
ncbi:type IV secretory system conjugative DNA transfer family protein [Leptolyngbya sp. Heron Island J]|uniref:type IV secretory system conjugative DNA transfer family protein n=1 Tax=Leptolyngbya sp. Heron Island J TaxID=1385935 RepID=UPI0004058C57|nr:type IV secretion system DNA-binding domain-containing protein [Leptolyngbya sp. Heron Island J]